VHERVADSERVIRVKEGVDMGMWQRTELPRQGYLEVSRTGAVWTGTGFEREVTFRRPWHVEESDPRRKPDKATRKKVRRVKALVARGQRSGR
jgi:hypothetical protein